MSETLKLEKLFKSLNPQLVTYANLVFETNQKFNLTGFKTFDTIWNGLVINAFDGFKNLILNDEELKHVIDLGSGAGNPGILLALLLPNTKIYLVDANEKKCRFMDLVINKLNLKNCIVICSRGEELNFEKYSEFFDLGISRAVGSIKVVNELLAQWIKINGKIVHFKSGNYLRELTAAKLVCMNLGLKFLQVVSTANHHMQFNNVIFQKVKSTSKKYPRTWNKIIGSNSVND